MKIAIAGGNGVVGSYAAAAARAAGHDVVSLSRHDGVDVKTGTGLADALHGVEVVVDTLNITTMKRSAAVEFFTSTSRRLQEVGTAQGVRHIVTLSIVGIDRVPGFAYYAAKVAQERAVSEGPLPVTILRATQFHEFATQLLGRMRWGPIAVVPHMRSQPVAARTVGEHLARLAVERPAATLELAGPDVHDVADLARRTVAARGARLPVLAVTLPGKASKQMRSGALLGGPDAAVDGPSFDGWLATDDARRIPFTGAVDAAPRTDR